MVLLYIGLAAVFLIVFAYVFRQKEKGERFFGHAYLLDDSNFARTDEGEVRDERVETWFSPADGRYLGYGVLSFPREAELRSLNLTTPPGGTTNMYISLMFQLAKWEWLGRMKVDEWIEVSPTFAQYYQITLRQREEIETRIKQGLASAAQAVSDLELLKHDQRKYREFLEYFGFEYNENTRQWKDTGKKDEHSLRALFIDMVDAHTGEGISIRSIVQRWPTLIVDFQKLSDEDIEPDKIKDKLNVSKAEAVVLSTKNRLYVQWKRLFEPEVKARYERIFELVRSREKSVEAYREWLKPLIARHKMLEEGLQRKEKRAAFKYGREGALLMFPGTANALTDVTVWAWHWVTLQELEKGGTERLAIENEEELRKADAWTKRELIFHPKHGLIRKHSWITEEWVDKKTDEIWQNNWFRREKLYYAFVIIEMLRGNMRTASGEEIEDTVFTVNGGLFSRNVLLVKLLELLAKQEEFNRYVDDLLGVKHEVPLPEGEPLEIKHRLAKWRATSSRFLDFFTFNRFRFMKHGPYERDFAERLTKYWFRVMSQSRYEPVIRFLKDKIGMGVS